jgi:hypothetical protein
LINPLKGVKTLIFKQHNYTKMKNTGPQEVWLRGVMVAQLPTMART